MMIEGNHPLSLNKPTKLAVVGYYGFGNLGDELILRSLTRQLAELSVELEHPIELTVLSANPTQTVESLRDVVAESMLSLNAVFRMSIGSVIQTLRHSDALIVGGGGLFQDESSIRTPVYYGGLVGLAKVMGCSVWMWGQGLTPLKTMMGKLITRLAFQQADRIALRDSHSVKQAKEWVGASKTVEGMMDSVWALPLVLPERKVRSDDCLTIGVSLREWPELTDDRLQALASAFIQYLVKVSHLQKKTLRVQGWVFQENQDRAVLARFAELIQERWATTVLDESMRFTWEWVTADNLFEKIEVCDRVLGMRFHALVLVLKARKPVLGISYSSKVERLMTAGGFSVCCVADLESPTLAEAFQHMMDGEDDVSVVTTWEQEAQRDRERLKRWLESRV